MARIKGAINAKKKHKRVLKLAKGYRGARSKQYRIAKQSVMRARLPSSPLCVLWLPHLQAASSAREICADCGSPVSMLQPGSMVSPTAR